MCKPYYIVYTTKYFLCLIVTGLQGERTNNLISGFLQIPSSSSPSNRNSLNVLVELSDEGSTPRLPPSGLSTYTSCPFIKVNNETLEEEASDDDNDEDDTDADDPPEESVAAVRKQIVDLLLPTPSLTTPNINPPTSLTFHSPSNPPSLLPHLSMTPGPSSRRGSILIPTEDWPINPYLFRTLFPFHIIFDRELAIKFMGVSLSRLFPNAISNQAKLTDYFTIERPAIPASTYTHIRSRAHNEFVIKTKDGVIPPRKDFQSKSLQFRGQMVPTSSHIFSPILFIASPRVQSIEELEGQGLYLSDIPVHDVTRELILLNHQLRAEMNIASQLERMKWRLEEEKSRVQNERERADKLLHAMLPKTVAKKLMVGEEARATFHSKVTILFSDIEGFTTVCSECSHPVEVVQMLNDLYTKFDSCIDECQVYKVKAFSIIMW